MRLREPSTGLVTHLRAMGLAVAVRSHGPDASAIKSAVDESWRDCLADPPSDAAPVVIDCVLDADPLAVAERRDRRVVAETSLDLLLDRLSPAITLEAIDHHRGELLMMHACGLAHPRTGATVALVAGSGTGKTTLARTLGSTFGYVTDETVGVGPDGSVVAYPKPLSLLDGGRPAFKRQVAASELGLLGAPGVPLHLGGLVVLEREPGRSEPEVQQVPTLESLAMLAPQVSVLGALDRPLHFVAGLIHACGGVRHATYGEAESLRGLVADLVEGRS